MMGPMTFAQLGSGAECLRISTEPETRTERLVADLRSGGLSAGLPVVAFLAQGFVDLVAFFESLEADWRGFAGVRRWESLEGELVLEARHEFRNLHVRVHLRTVGPGWGNEGWQARADLTIEPGEQLSRFVADLRALLVP